jgi:catechol 2,3-dioxygenase-like lactoylglutathione lyase family enzyme
MLRIDAIHHVQITIPKGQEAAARAFYCDVMGLEEIPKPPALAGRGGFWLAVGDRELHIGVETGGDRSATKAHVAYRVSDIGRWRERLQKAGVSILDSAPIPGIERFEFRDPFGNRVELIQPSP